VLIKQLRALTEEDTDVGNGFLVLKMLIVLTAGLLLWIGYGVLKSDWVIVAANSVGAALSASVLIFKIRDMRAGK